MTRHGTPNVVLIAAVVALAVLSAGCGLGDLPTRPPVSAEPPSAADSPSPSPTSPPSPTASPTPSPVPSPTALIYTVKPGDNLLTIAKRFKTTGRSIAYWNRARYPSLDPDSPKYDPNRIEVGWKLTIIPGVKIDEPPDASAGTPTPQPSIALGPIQTPPVDGSGLLLTHGSRESNVVVLTFDLDGPAGGGLPIVQWLIDQRLPATFFVTGQLLQTDPSSVPVLAAIAAHPDLFDVGDGTWSRPELTSLTSAAVADQLGRAETVIGSATGRTTKPFFRPPDGAQNQAVRTAAAAAGFPYTVLWDIDPDDGTPESSGGPTTDQIVTLVASPLQGGSIVLLHLGGGNTLAALPGIVAAIRADGLIPLDLERSLGR